MDGSPHHGEQQETTADRKSDDRGETPHSGIRRGLAEISEAEAKAAEKQAYQAGLASDARRCGARTVWSHAPVKAATRAFTFFWRHCGSGAISQ